MFPYIIVSTRTLIVFATNETRVDIHGRERNGAQLFEIKVEHVAIDGIQVEIAGCLHLVLTGIMVGFVDALSFGLWFHSKAYKGSKKKGGERQRV